MTRETKQNAAGVLVIFAIVIVARIATFTHPVSIHTQGLLEPISAITGRRPGVTTLDKSPVYCRVT